MHNVDDLFKLLYRKANCLQGLQAIEIAEQLGWGVSTAYRVIKDNEFFIDRAKNPRRPKSYCMSTEGLEKKKELLYDLTPMPLPEQVLPDTTKIDTHAKLNEGLQVTLTVPDIAIKRLKEYLSIKPEERDIEELIASIAETLSRGDWSTVALQSLVLMYYAAYEKVQENEVDSLRLQDLIKHDPTPDDESPTGSIPRY